MSSSSGIYGGLTNLPPTEVTHDWRVKELREIAHQAAEMGARQGFIEDVLEAAVDLIVKPDDAVETVQIGFQLGTNEHEPWSEECEEGPDAD